MMKTVGILLAGGLSRRFGSPKAFAELAGSTFYERVYEALDAACDQVVIVSREELLERFSQHLDVIVDLPEVRGQGPLAGIYSAMMLRPAERYIVLPCDMPFIGVDETLALIKLAGEAKGIAAVMTPNEKIPLFSIWNGDYSAELKDAIDAGSLGVFGFLDNIQMEWIDAHSINKELEVFRNVNSRID